MLFTQYNLSPTTSITIQYSSRTRGDLLRLQLRQYVGAFTV